MQQRRIAFRRQQRLAHRALRKSALFIPLLFIFFLQSRSLGVLTAARDAVLAPAARPAVRTAAPAERCADRDPQCAGWARKGRCDLEPYIMYDKCSRSCGVCPPPYLRQVPDDVVLPGNVTMPRVGFGTAGLGNATAAVVGAAIRAGFRKIDTAEAKEWCAPPPPRCRRRRTAAAAAHPRPAPPPQVPRGFGRTCTFRVPHPPAGAALPHHQSAPARLWDGLDAARGQPLSLQPGGERAGPGAAALRRVLGRLV
jgi:hypothetical protein